MKLNIIPAVIAVALALLLGFLVYALTGNADNNTGTGITTALAMIVTLVPAMALKLENSRVGTNVRVLSILFAVVLFGISIVVALINPAHLTFYYIAMAIIALIYLAILNSLARVRGV